MLIYIDSTNFIFHISIIHIFICLFSAYMIKGNYNVIVVDWSEKAKSKCYPRVTKLLPDVGRIVARFVDLLVAAGASLDKIHLIGFSLGAHVAGYAGTFNNGTVARITGENIIMFQDVGRVLNLCFVSCCIWEIPWQCIK